VSVTHKVLHFPTFRCVGWYGSICWRSVGEQPDALVAREENAATAGSVPKPYSSPAFATNTSCMVFERSALCGFADYKAGLKGHHSGRKIGIADSFNKLFKCNVSDLISCCWTVVMERPSFLAAFIAAAEVGESFS
jgi:hypothetical protein